MVYEKLHKERPIHEKNTEENSEISEEEQQNIENMAREAYKDMEEIKTRTQGIIPASTIQKLEQLQANLTAYIQQHDTKNIQQTLEKVFGAMEEAELQMTQKEEEEEIQTNKGDMLSHNDILSEYTETQLKTPNTNNKTIKTP